MPIKDGPTATREIRKQGYDGVIIGVTGCTSIEEKEVFLQNGVNSVLTKPLDLRELDRTILGENPVLVSFHFIASYRCLFHHIHALLRFILSENINKLN